MKDHRTQVVREQSWDTPVCTKTGKILVEYVMVFAADGSRHGGSDAVDGSGHRPGVHPGWRCLSQLRRGYGNSGSELGAITPQRMRRAMSLHDAHELQVPKSSLWWMPH